MAGENELERWWDGLNERQRTKAARSVENGRLTKGTLASLQAAGIIEPSEQPDRTVPGPLRDYLKMRH